MDEKIVGGATIALIICEVFGWVSYNHGSTDVGIILMIAGPLVFLAALFGSK